MLHWGCERGSGVSQGGHGGYMLEEGIGSPELEWLGTTTWVLGTEPESSLQVYQMPLTFEPLSSPSQYLLSVFLFYETGLHSKF